MTKRALLSMFLLAGFCTEALAQDMWSVLPLKNRGVDPTAVATFRDLLQEELSKATGASFVTAGTACSDVPCTQHVAAAVGASVGVYGSLSRLGKKIIVAVTVVDASNGSVVSNQKMTVDQIEDLDQVATRMAEAIAGGKSTEDTAKLGTLTTKDITPPMRRKGDSGFRLRLSGVAPLGDGHGGVGFGVGVELAYWFEALHFAIEPKLAVRFSTTSEEADFVEIPIDLGVYYIFGLGDFTPFVGGGCGVHFAWEERLRTVKVGEVVTSLHESMVDDSQWGFGLFGRAGVLLMRTYDVRVTITLDYNVTFVELNDQGPFQALTFGVGVIF